MTSDESTSRYIAWGPWIIGTLGAALVLLGAARFIFLGIVSIPVTPFIVALQ